MITHNGNSPAELFYITLQEKTDTDRFLLLCDLIGSSEDESEWIEFKSARFDDCKTEDEERKKIQSIWGKHLSGFANTGGGILIWGIGTKSVDGHDKPANLSLAKNARKFAARLKDHIKSITSPPVPNVEVLECVNVDQNLQEGFVVAFIPASSRKPHQVRAQDIEVQDRFYMRASHQTFPMPYEFLRQMFYPQFDPVLDFTVESIIGDGERVNLKLWNRGFCTVTEIYVQLQIFGMGAQRKPLNIQEEKFNFTKETSTDHPYVGSLVGLKPVHPNMYVSLGDLEAGWFFVVIITVFAKDMLPFWWWVERNGGPSHWKCDCYRDRSEVQNRIRDYIGDYKLKS